jgi:hypothetical protein
VVIWHIFPVLVYSTKTSGNPAAAECRRFSYEFLEIKSDQFLLCFVAVRPGVDVMITIFCDFRQFSVKKLAFFSKTNVMINFFQKLALFRVKNAKLFVKFFGENIFKIITSVPDEFLRKSP